MERRNTVVEAMLLVMAVAALASSVIFLRMIQLGAAEVSAWRTLLGAGAFLFLLKGGGGMPRGKDLTLAMGGGVLLGIHFMTWTLGARQTVAANATLLVNLVPLVLPFLLLPLAGEKVGLRDWTGTLLGFCGVLVVVGSNLSPEGTWRGDLACLGSMVFLAAYLAVSRRAGSRFTCTAAWAVPAFGTAALLAGVVSLVFESPKFPPPREWVLIVALVVFPTLLGHGMVARAMRYWRGQVVGVATGAQFLFAVIYGWLIFGEVPSPWYPLGAGLIATGIYLVATNKAHRVPPPRD